MTRGRAIAAVVLGSAVGLAAWWRTSPLPRVLLVRGVFTRGGMALHRGQAARVPGTTEERLDLAYGPDRDERLDVFRPTGAADPSEPLPTVVWIHGGAFVAGDKREIANYLRILADRGFTTIGVNYTLAPRASFPTPIDQVNRALRWIADNAEQLHADTDRIVLAGDSAGANLAAQVTAMISDPSYADRLGIAPALTPAQVRGSLLYCGVYDRRLFDLDGSVGGFLRTVLWAYGGQREPEDDADGGLASVRSHVTADFPAPFVSAGNADPLLAHSVAFVDALAELGVVADTLFFPTDHRPPLAHEYQFDASLDEFDLALDRSVAYLRRVTGAQDDPQPAEQGG